VLISLLWALNLQRDKTIKPICDRDAMQKQRPTVIFPAAEPHCHSLKNLCKLSLKRFVPKQVEEENGDGPQARTENGR